MTQRHFLALGSLVFLVLAPSLLLAETVVVSVPSKPQDLSPAQSDWDSLEQACTTYIQTFDPKAVVKTAFLKKVAQRVQTRQEDAGGFGNEESFFRDIAYDWMVDNRAKLEKEQDTILILQSCCYYQQFLERKISLPTPVLAEMTLSRLQKLVAFLTKQVEEKKLAAGSSVPLSSSEVKK